MGDRLAFMAGRADLVCYANTHDRGIFTPTVHSALQKIVQVLKCEQQHATCSH